MREPRGARYGQGADTVKVVIVSSTVPFVSGGDRSLTRWLAQALEQRGHEVDVFQIPVHAAPDQLPAQCVGLRMMDFTGFGDRLIAIRTPSYLVRHHHKVVWFIHHHRPAYDLWDEFRDVPHDPQGWEFRRMLFAADELALSEAKQVFTNSRRMLDRLRHYNGLEGEVLYPPLAQDTQVTAGPHGDYLVYVSRVEPHKRQLLAVEAMGLTTTPVRLVLCGTGMGTEYSQAIYRRIDELGLAHRVSFINSRVTEATKNSLLSGALASVYLPHDEDSYGYVGLESALAARPVVTTKDSGGVLELVQDEVNGLVSEPEPAPLARAFDRLYGDRELAAGLGDAHEARMRELHINWDHVVDRLLS